MKRAMQSLLLLLLVTGTAGAQLHITLGAHGGLSIPSFPKSVSDLYKSGFGGGLQGDIMFSKNFGTRLIADYRVFASDKDKLKEAPKGWADFFDTKKYPGKRSLRQGPKTTLEIALMADGVAPGDVYKTLATDAGVERAFRKLDQLKANLIWWEKGAQPPQLLASGEAVMVDAYNGRIAAANDKDKKNFKIVWTNNLYTIDSWVIMKGTPNKAEAEKYLAFVNDPNNQKNLPPRIPYGVTTTAATALIDKNVLPNLATAPENIKTALYINDKFWLENLDKLNQRFNAWVAK